MKKVNHEYKIEWEGTPITSLFFVIGMYEEGEVWQVCLDSG
jgi:hypothetical protein